MQIDTRRKMEAFLDFLFEWNARSGLTAFKTKKEAWSRGVAPSLAALPFIPSGARLLDIGSGGGFPAVCLAISGDKLSIVCAEPASRKALFLERTAAHLRLDVKVEVGSADEVLRRSGSFDAVTVRGVKMRRGTIKRIAGSINSKGVFLVWSGGDRFDTYRDWISHEGLSVKAIDLVQPDLRMLVGRK